MNRRARQDAPRYRLFGPDTVGHGLERTISADNISWTVVRTWLFDVSRHMRRGDIEQH